MAENIWFPRIKHDGTSMTYSNAPTAIGSPKQPEFEANPAVGDTILLEVSPWGGVSIHDGQSIMPQGATVLECEIKAVKTAKVTVTLEDSQPTPPAPPEGSGEVQQPTEGQ